MEEQWTKIQNDLKKQLIVENKVPNKIRYVGGVDVSFPKDTSRTDAYAAIVVIDVETFDVVYQNCIKVEVTEPYIAGFLAFREVKHLVKLVDELKENASEFIPDVILVDGNGVFHYREFGLASHLGVLIGIPTIGIGKSFLFVDSLDRKTVRKMFDEKCSNTGDQIPLIGASGKMYGVALKPRDNVTKPIYVSIGHMVDLPTAVNVVLALSKYRVPEPVRLADKLSRSFI